MELGLAVSSSAATVKVRKESDAGVRAEVDFSGKGSDSDVKPVLVEGSVFLD